MIGPLHLVAVAVGMFPALACGFGVAPEAQEIPVLVYHRFAPVASGETTIQTAKFEAHLRWLAQHGIRVAPLREAVEILCGTRQATGPMVVITADDGHRSVYSEMFPLIERYRVPVTLFIYPTAISNAPYALTWEQLRTMQRSGLVDVQSHTWWHPDFRKEKARRSEADYRAFVDLQLTRSRTLLEKELGTHVDLLAWPFGVVDADLERAAREADYLAAFGYAGGSAHRGADCLALPRIPVPAHAGESWLRNLLAREARGGTP